MSRYRHQATTRKEAEVKFYDSDKFNDIPQGAEYAALYADGRYAITPQDNIKRIPHRRFITVTGANSYDGIADFERLNPVFDEEGKLRDWATRRLRNHQVPPVVYCDRSDLAYAMSELRGLPRYWWIPTLDNKEWTAEELAINIDEEFHISIPVEQIWANQYTDHSNQYDESNLFLTWFI